MDLYYASLLLLTLMLFRRDAMAGVYFSLKYTFNYNAAALLSSLFDNLKKNKNHIAEYPSKAGEVAIVTGGARGLGLDVVRGLLKCGMHVIIAARSLDAGNKCAETLRQEGYPGSVSAMQLDVSSMKSVERFADEFKSKHGQLHVLVNNAGILFGEYGKTEDGFERQLATNYLGHFYLTHLLMDCLKNGGKKGKSARVVNVSSCAHYGIHMFFEDFNMENSYHPTAGYARSKMAQILSTRYLNRMFEAENLPIKMYAAHPGIVGTDMFYKHPATQNVTWMGRFFKTPAEGAINVIYCAISPNMEHKGGTYMSNCEEGYSTSYSQKYEHQKRLFNESCKMLNIKKFGQNS